MLTDGAIPTIPPDVLNAIRYVSRWLRDENTNCHIGISRAEGKVEHWYWMGTVQVLARETEEGLEIAGSEEIET